MSELEQKLLKTMATAIQEMDDFEKGYFLGAAETKANSRRKRRKGKQKPANRQKGEEDAGSKIEQTTNKKRPDQ